MPLPSRTRKRDLLSKTKHDLSCIIDLLDSFLFPILFFVFSSFSFIYVYFDFKRKSIVFVKFCASNADSVKERKLSHY